MAALNRGRLAACREFLRTELAEGAKTRESLQAGAQRAGYNWKNVEMAATQLGVVRDRVKLEQGWRASWRMPDPEELEETEETEEAAAPELPKVRRVKPEEAPQITAALAQVQKGTANVDIFRYVDGEPNYLDTLPANEVSLRLIKRRYGGGRYLVGGVQFAIEGRPVSSELEAPAKDARAAAPAPGALDPNQLVLLMLKQQGEFLAALLSNKGGGTVDPISVLEKLDEMAKRRQQDPIPQPIDQAMAILKEGMELGARVNGRDLSEEEEDGVGFGRVIKAAGPFLEALASRMTAPPPGQPAITAGPVAVQPPPAAVTYLDRVLQDVRPIFAQLNEQARAGTAVDRVTGYLLENMTDEQWQQFAAAVQDEQFPTQLTDAIVRETPAFSHEWYRRLITQLTADVRSEIAEEDRGERPDINGTGPGSTTARQ